MATDDWYLPLPRLLLSLPHYLLAYLPASLLPYFPTSLLPATTPTLTTHHSHPIHVQLQHKRTRDLALLRDRVHDAFALRQDLRHGADSADSTRALAAAHARLSHDLRSLRDRLVSSSLPSKQRREAELLSLSTQIDRLVPDNNNPNSSNSNTITITSTSTSTSTNLNFSQNTSSVALQRKELLSAAPTAASSSRDAATSLALDISTDDSDDLTNPMSSGELLQLQTRLIDDQDAHLDALSNTILRQKHIGMQIGDELDLHVNLLQQTDESMERTQSRLGNVNRDLTGEDGSPAMLLTTRVPRPFAAIVLVLALVLLAMLPAGARADDASPSSPSAADDAAALPPGFVPTDFDSLSGEKFQFQSDNKKVLNIVINSLYKTKEIFLRELISNSADALDKIRFQSLTKPDALGEETDLAIRIVADKERKLLVITDTGIGMTSEELKKNLGTIARSGTSEFVSLLEDKNADLSMIGQFGVGFYSVFLVCDRVSVASKSNDSPKQMIWESTSENDFTIGVDPRGNTLKRGTEITLHLKDDAVEFLETTKLELLVKKYSEFITFPIYLWKEKVESYEPEAEDSFANEDGVEDVSEESDEPKESKPNPTRTVHLWERVNQNKPIWARKPADLSAEDYNEFYKAFSNDMAEPMAYTHFSAEGDNEFKAILFIPKKAPTNFLQKLESVAKNVKLFVRRVFITDENDLMPRWLSFITGLVDSDDLPLNVSRETLQKHHLLKAIKKKLIAKAIEMIRKVAGDETKYLEFFKQYGTALKLGIVEDRKNQEKLSKIVRFHSSHSTEGMTTLVDYKKRMKSKQPQIYYVTGSNLDDLRNSPVVEVPLARGYEVLYMVDPIDEYLLQSLREFDGTPLQSLSKAGLEYGDEDKDEESKIKEEFAELASWLKSTLDEYVETVVVSTRLAKSPTAVIANKMGLSGNMEKIMNAQALQSGENYMLTYYQSLKKTLEINPYHPLIKALNKKIDAAAEDNNNDDYVEMAKVLYESTLIRSGFELKNSHEFAGRVEQILRANLGVPKDAEADYVVVPAPEKTEDDDSDAGKSDNTVVVEENDHDEL
ncbi:hypothetical protein HDU84_002901 [Entophlyctis sp. JEL0112]|nr:hypothetical protein HDU84_002901 [Entophlyctis sp. JEL0112]